MCLRSAAKTVAPNNTGKATSLAGADHIDVLVIGEDVDQDLIARLDALCSFAFCGCDLGLVNNFAA